MVWTANHKDRQETDTLEIDTPATHLWTLNDGKYGYFSQAASNIINYAAVQIWMLFIVVFSSNAVTKRH